MRGIKFRIHDDGEMHYVTQLNIYGEEYETQYEVDLCDTDGNQEYFGVIVKSEELMQYTGLKDKNGIEIYEGDICKVTDEEWYCNSYFNINEPWSMNMKVINEEYAFAFQDLQDKHKEIFLYETNYNDFEIEVIGNIYENKELLEVEKSSEKASTTFVKGNITFNQTGNNNTIIGSVDTLIL